MTARKTGALTVAGQWRSFTAFPSILAIAVVNWLPLEGQPKSHETVFNDINIYSRGYASESKS
jgi:hypothetical protein